MSEYELEELKTVIGKVRPLVDVDSMWMVRYLRLQSLFVYYGYAVATVHTQEENIVKMRDGQHKNFATHDEYADCLNKIYASTVNVYADLRTCIATALDIVKQIPEIERSKELEALRAAYRDWANGVVDRRDRASAHPAQNEEEILWKPSGWNDKGMVTFRLINHTNPTESREIALNPRTDLEKLREYLVLLAQQFQIEWRIEQTELEGSEYTKNGFE